MDIYTNLYRLLLLGAPKFVRLCLWKRKTPHLVSYDSRSYPFIRPGTYHKVLTEIRSGRKGLSPEEAHRVLDEGEKLWSYGVGSENDPIGAVDIDVRRGSSGEVVLRITTTVLQP